MTVTADRPVAPDPASWFTGVVITAALIKANITDPLNAAAALLGDTGFQTLPVGATWTAFSGHTPQWRMFAGYLDLIGIIQRADAGTFATSQDLTICNAGTIPAAFGPANSVNRALSTLNGGPSNLVRGYVGVDGSVHVVTNGSTFTALDLSGLCHIAVGM